MATIPIYDQQVEAKPTPGFRQDSVATPTLLGGAADSAQNFGRGLNAAGADAAKVAVSMQEREDMTAVLDVEAARKTAAIAAEADIRKLQGANAAGASQKIKEWWDKAAQEDSSLLTSDRQREVYQRRMQPTALQSLYGVSQFEANQGQVALTQAAKASVVSAQDTAAADPTPSTVAIQMDAIRQVRTAQATREGWAEGQGGKPGVLDTVLKDDFTRLHSGVIANLVDKAPDVAREYFKAHKSEIAGGAYDNIEKLLDTGETKVTGQRAADKAKAENMTEPEALAWARKTYEGAKRTAAEHEIKVRYAEDVQQRERAQKTASDTAWGIYSRTGSVSAVPAAVLSAMDGKDLAAMQNNALLRAQGKAPKTDNALYYDLRRLATENPDAFAKVNLNKFADALSPSNFQEFVKLQTAPADTTETESSLSNQFKVTFRIVDWKESNDKEKMGNFEATARQAINQEEKAKGKKLDAEGRQKVIDRMLVKGDVNGWVPMGGRRYWEVRGTPEAETFVPDVPAKDRAQIADAFKKRGVFKPTDEQILQAYKAQKGLK